jgi:hypothetical protein
MKEIKKLIVFNHNIETAISKVKEYYNGIFDNVILAIPLAEEIDSTISYHTGSYLWQGAIVNAIEFMLQNENEHNKSRGLFIFHDDVALNRSTINDYLLTLDKDFMFGNSLYDLNINITENEPYSSWDWSFKLITNWFSPKSVSYGSGVDSVANCLKKSTAFKKYQENSISHVNSRVKFTSKLNADNLFKAYFANFFPNQSTLDFEMPLAIGNSDILYIPCEFYKEALDFLKRTIQCGIFVECAIPTYIKLHSQRYDTIEKSIDFPFGDDYNKFKNLKSFTEIDSYLSNNNKLAIHPVKFSQL